MFKEIFQYRDLLFMLVKRDIRIRYKQASMGFLWAIFMPIVALCAGILIKKAMSVVSGRPMDIQGIISIMVKVLPWTFFISATKFSVQSLVGNSNLVTKIYFPREVLPLSSLIACLFDFSIAIIVLTVILTAMNVGASIYLLWVPVLLLILIIFTAGLGLFLSAANLFYRDVKYVVEVILSFGIFFTPVLFEAKVLGDWGIYMLLNPVGSILESLNSAVVLHQSPDLNWVVYAASCAVIIFIVGINWFHKREPYFAENI
jgi:ABC-type polysaccharide/polyol phosphate export permease